MISLFFILFFFFSLNVLTLSENIDHSKMLWFLWHIALHGSSIMKHYPNYKKKKMLLYYSIDLLPLPAHQRTLFLPPNWHTAQTDLWSQGCQRVNSRQPDNHRCQPCCQDRHRGLNVGPCVPAGCAHSNTWQSRERFYNAWWGGSVSPCSNL